jgi:hypothetical protein
MSLATAGGAGIGGGSAAGGGLSVSAMATVVHQPWLHIIKPIPSMLINTLASPVGLQLLLLLPPEHPTQHWVQIC